MAGTARAAAANEIPEKLGRYHVLGVVGRGNMGVVYSGYDPYLDRDVAIKVCTLGNGGTEEANTLTRRMFYNEAHTAGILHHPHILKVLDAGEQGDRLYIVMEYVDGGETLARYCQPEKLLPPKKVAEIVFTCANALDYAHRQGVVHRDIKPSNVLFTADGTLKLGDFGIAQRIVADTTLVLGVMGTPHYLSPEQIGEHALDGQTDIYSLGVLTYELLTGRRPFTGRTLTHLLHRICNEEPPGLGTLRPDLPEGLSEVVHRAMHRDREQRYARARELADALARLYVELETTEYAVPEEERFRLTRDLQFFASFRDNELWEVLRACKWSVHEPGHHIITEGASGMSMFVIVSGDVLVSKRGNTINRLQRGDCFGEMGYLAESPRSASIVAASDVTLIEISDAVMNQASSSCELQFLRSFVRVLVERLSNTSDDLSRSLGHVGEPATSGERPAAAEAGE